MMPKETYFLLEPPRELPALSTNVPVTRRFCSMKTIFLARHKGSIAWWQSLSRKCERNFPDAIYDRWL